MSVEVDSLSVHVTSSPSSTTSIFDPIDWNTLTVPTSSSDSVIYKTPPPTTTTQQTLSYPSSQSITLVWPQMPSASTIASQLPNSSTFTPPAVHDSQHNDTVSAGAIAAIVVPCLIVGGMVIVVITLAFRRRRRGQPQKASPLDSLVLGSNITKSRSPSGNGQVGDGKHQENVGGEDDMEMEVKEKMFV